MTCRAHILLLLAGVAGGAEAQEHPESFAQDPAAASPAPIEQDEAPAPEELPTIPVQTAADPEPAGLSEPQTTQLEEIVVTAQKRSQTLQEVPMSVSAITEGDIQKRGVDSFRDFAFSVPGLKYDEVDPNRSKFTVRGVSTSATPVNAQDTVAVYLNEMPLQDIYGNAATPDLRLTDVARIEVLRGPQGTLFGAGSLAGAVRIIPNAPDPSQTEGFVRIGYGLLGDGHPRQRYDGMLNLPLGDTGAALRAVGFMRDEEGWIRNEGLDRDPSNNTTAHGVRAALSYAHPFGWGANLSVLSERARPEDGQLLDPNRGKYVRSTSVPEATRVDLDYANLTATYDFDLAQLLSSTSYIRKKANMLIDAVAPMGPPTGPVLGDLVQLVAHSADQSKSLVQELRLTSPGGETVDWVGGLFYYEILDRLTTADLRADLRDSPLTLAELFALLDPGGSLPVSNSLAYAEIVAPATAYAAYGDVTWSFSQDWSLAAGLRYSRYETGYQQHAEGALLISPESPTGSSDTQTASEVQDSLTPRATLTWEPDASRLLYLLAASGFRAGHVNPAVPVETPSSYGPDSLWNYEFGWKTRWFDRRLTLNGAAYYIDWKDIQVDLYKQGQVLNYSYGANAGRARSRGVELEIQAAPWDWLGLTTAATWQDARIVATTPETEAQTGARVGDPLPGSARFSVGNTVQFSTTPGWFDIHLAFLQFTHQYVGKSVSTFSGQNAQSGLGNRQGDYHVYGLNAGMSAPAWDLNFIVRNLADSYPRVTVIPAASTQALISLPPRSFELQLTVRF